MVRVVVVAHWSSAGVNVYSVVAVLLIAGSPCTSNTVIRSQRQSWNSSILTVRTDGVECWGYLVSNSNGKSSCSSALVISRGERILRSSSIVNSGSPCTSNTVNRRQRQSWNSSILTVRTDGVECWGYLVSNSNGKSSCSSALVISRGERILRSSSIVNSAEPMYQ